MLQLMAKNKIQFSIEGPGTIKAAGNGDPTCLLPFSGNEMYAYQGKCLAIIRSTKNNGKIAITASANGLKSTSIEFQSIKKGNK